MYSIYSSIHLHVKTSVLYPCRTYTVNAIASINDAYFLENIIFVFFLFCSSFLAKKKAWSGPHDTLANAWMSSFLMYIGSINVPKVRIVTW